MKCVSAQTIAMTDCNHAAKNIHLQLVCDSSSVVIGGNGCFDVDILRLVGLQSDLHCCANVNALDIVCYGVC